jgi:CheY-like chemotaxis protein
VSQDQSTTANNQEVDLDDIEVEILIVAKNSKPLSQASAFLSRRGWPTSVVSNLAQAIELASEKKPDFVLVSLNHQNPAMPKFIELVQSTFNATVVAFVENMDTASNQKLNKSNYKYKVFGQMSGPNLHRSIRRILSEKFNIGGGDHKNEETKRDPRGGDESISIKGAGQGGKDSQVVIQKSESGNGHSATSEAQEVLSTDKYKMGRANRRSLKDLTASQNGEPPQVAYISPSGKESKELAARLKNSLFGAGGSVASQGENDTTEGALGGQQSDGPSRGQVSEGLQNERGLGGGASEPETRNGKKLRDLQAQWNSNSLPEQATLEQQFKEQSVTRAGEPARAPAVVVDAPSVIERAVQMALERVCQPSEDALQIVEKIENVGVFPIDSPSMPGYLVLAWPNAEPRAEEAFFRLAQESLRNIFEESGVQGRVEQGFFVQIPQVDFEQWTGQAAFNLRFRHRDRELAVAFFKLSGPMPKAKPVDGNQMYSIGVKHVSTERPVTFKAYLHLKKNNKYFLYLRNGRQLLPEQQQRLEESNVKDFYMKSIDVENFRSFLAASHLTETVKKSARGNGGGSKAA